MTETAEVIRATRRLAARYNRGEHTEQEVVIYFLAAVFHAPLTATDECFAAFPQAASPGLLEHLKACAERDHYDDCQVHIRGWLDLGLDVAQQEQVQRQMQPHYRAVGERLLMLLANANAN